MRSRAEKINADEREADYLYANDVLSPTDSAASEARMAELRAGAQVCPLCKASVDPTNWRKHFAVHHNIPTGLLDESAPESEYELELGGRGALLQASSGQYGLLAFVDSRLAYVDTQNGRRHYDRKKLTLIATARKAEDELPQQPESETSNTNDTEQNPAIVRLDEARALLAQLHNVDDVKAIRDKAEAMRVYARQVHLGLEAQNHAAEIKLRAERRAGELLREMDDPRGGDRKSETAKNQKSHDATIDRTPTLADLGISKSQSSRWQAIAALPEEQFEATIAATKESEKELTTATALRQARAHITHTRRTQAAQTPLPQGRYRCIVIDPPWPMTRIERDVRPNQDALLDYPPMSLAEIAALPVGDLAHEDGCHLYLWTTQKYLPEALSILQGWGFTYQCLFTWVKPGGMTPYSWMYNTELVLFARRGNLPLERNGLKLSFEAAPSGHSIKPDVFYDERVIPASPEPRLDMFARRERDGFKVWGDEVAHGQTEG